MPAELVDLNRILLTLARSREFPDGSSRHGYDFIAPLDPEGHIDPMLWKKYRDTAGFGDFGRARTTKSVASCTSLAALNTHAWFSSTIPVGMTTMKLATSSVNMRFCLGDYVSISGKDGKLQTFRVTSVNPVLLSMALVKSFELEIKV
jgi:hypothetical protein